MANQHVQIHVHNIKRRASLNSGYNKAGYGVCPQSTTEPQTGLYCSRPFMYSESATLQISPNYFKEK